MRGMAWALALLAAPAVAQTTSLAEFQAQSAGPQERARAVLNCAIRPLRVVEVASPLNGVVTEVLVAPGDRVEPGQPLALLDDRMLRADLAVARAFAEATASLDTAETRRLGAAAREARLAVGLERGAVNQSDYDDAALGLALAVDEVAQEEERLRLAGAELERIEAQVEMSTIRAQVSGVIGEDLIDPGEGTQARSIATIFVNEPLRVEVFVPAAQLLDVVEHDGEHAILVDSSGSEDRRVPVHFDYASQVADVASNTISVFFFLEDPDILPGARCRMPMPGSEM